MNTNHFQPNYIKKFNIYDIFHNDDNKLIIIIPCETKPYIIKYIASDNKILTFELYTCPHNHTYIYSLHIEYNKKIKLNIDDNIIETHVNKYPTFKNEIIFSTMVKNEDNYIKQWIDFHVGIGISRFIIYDNMESNDGKSYCSIEKTSNLSLLLSDYIKKDIVYLIKWSYPKRLQKSGISGQTTQQNHSIYAFRNSKYIGLFDIDEYVNMQGIKNINCFFNELIIKENIDINKISSFKLLNKFFYNPNNMPTDNNNFLKIFNCNNVTESGHEKNFVIPKNVNTFSVHMVTSGKPMYSVNKKYAYFNHYYYLNKNDRGKNITLHVDQSILFHI